MLRSSRGRIALVAALLAVCVVAALVVGPKAYHRLRGESTEPLAADSISTPKVAGQTAYIAANDLPGPRKLMLFTHGNDADHTALTLSRLHDWAQGLVDDGWVVAASDAHGNDWGSPAIEDDYRALYDHLADQFDISETVIVSESLGALSGLRLVTDSAIPGVTGWAAVSPVVDVGAALDDDELAGYIEADGDADEARDLDPANVDRIPVPAVIAVALDDDVVNPSTGEEFAKAHDLPLLTCSGGHVAEGCYAELDLSSLS